MMELLRKLRDFLRRDALAEELDQELRFHREQLAREARTHGLSAADAERAARVRLGSTTTIREDSRSMWSFTWLEQLSQDFRYALRALRRNPGFTIVATLTLALGIGATTAIFTVINGVVLRPLPYHDPDRIVVLWERTDELPRIMVSYPNFLDWKGRHSAFEDVGIYNPYKQFTQTAMGDAVRLRGGLGSGNLFDVLGVRAAIGRTFTAEDDRVGAERVVVLTDGFWKRRFGGDTAAVGKRMTLDGESYAIIGVLPPRVQLASSELWVPLGLFGDTEQFRSRENHPGTIGIARLKPGVTLAQMQADLDGLYAKLRAEYPRENAGISASGTWILDIVLGGIRRSLYVIAGAVVLVLLIACANVANLLVGRAASRQREMALRVAIGARRGRILRQLLTESVVLSTVGGALGLALAYGGVQLLLTLQPSNVPRLGDIHLDARVLMFALGASLLTGVMFGLAPALHTVRNDLVQSLRDGGRGASAGRARLRLRIALMVSEVALALMLLVGAGLLVRSFGKLIRVDTGADPVGVVTGLIVLPTTKYVEPAQQHATFVRLLERVRAIPGIIAAATASDLPVSTNWQTGVLFEGIPVGAPGSEPLLNAVSADADWFAAMRMRIVAGRGIDASDRAGSELVVVISEAVARRYFPNESAVGRRLKRAPAGSANPWITIVGVVNDVRDNGIAIASRGTMYLPYAQDPGNAMWLGVRAKGDPAQLVPALRAALADIDPNVPLAGVQTLEERVTSLVAPQRFAMLMLGSFAVLALALAVIGIYGVISYAVALRTHEIGVRVALGARRFDVVRLVGRQVLATTGVGIVVGGIASFATSGVLSTFLYGVEPSDPVTFIAVAALLGGAAVIAAAVPAWRAMRLDPVAALRAD